MDDVEMRAAFEAWHTRNFGEVHSLEEYIFDRRFKIWRAAAAHYHRAGMARAAKVCDQIELDLHEYAERNYNAEDLIAKQCAAAIRAEMDHG